MLWARLSKAYPFTSGLTGLRAQNQLFLTPLISSLDPQETWEVYSTRIIHKAVARRRGGLSTNKYFRAGDGLEIGLQVRQSGTKLTCLAAV